MRVGIPGSGLMGGKLGRLLWRAGHEVVFSYARSQKNVVAHLAGRGRTCKDGSEGAGRLRT